MTSPTYSSDFLAALRRHLRDAIATREEIEFSDAFDSLERAHLLKQCDREINRFEREIDNARRGRAA